MKGLADEVREAIIVFTLFVAVGMIVVLTWPLDAWRRWRRSP
jgi:hypothetical protein